MAWNRNTGGRNQGPWGQGPNPGGGNSGGSREQPPDLDDILKRSQDRLRRAFPPGFGGSAMIVLLLGALAVVWVLSGIYIVSPTQQAVVLSFGKFARFEPSGMHWHIPWPVETIYLPEVTRVVRVDIGGANNSDNSDTADDLMLTKDRNFLIVNFTVQFQIKDAKDYLFNVNNPPSSPYQAVIDVSKAAMREVVGRSNFDSLQTDQRTAAELQTKKIIQDTLDTYHAGIQVVEVNIQRVDPPDEALKAARDVESARQDQQTAQNNAEAYQNKVIPQARGQAQRILQDAEAYKQSVIADAQGQSQRFDLIYDQYKRAPDVTRRRMYLETMESLLAGMNKVIVDQKSGGVVPYLPLPGLHSNAAAPADGGK
jgi:membrane protease subunit HflK